MDDRTLLGIMEGFQEMDRRLIPKPGRCLERRKLQRFRSGRCAQPLGVGNAEKNENAEGDPKPDGLLRADLVRMLAGPWKSGRSSTSKRLSCQKNA